MSGPEPETLYGWKEIASYLQVTVRAAQSWEKHRGLPVRRYPRGERPRVYALRAELDGWMRRSAADDLPGSKSFERSGTRRGVYVLALVAVVAVVSTVVFRSLRTGSAKVTATRCEISGRTLNVFDQYGERLWAHLLPELSERYGSGDRRFPGCTIMDVDLDGSREVLVQFVGQDRFSGGKLICFRPGIDTPLWEHRYGKPLRWGTKEYSGSYVGKLIRQVTAHGKSYVVSVARHAPSFPAVVSLLDPTSGKVVDEYAHPGHIVAVEFADLDGDDEPEALLGGILNPGSEPGWPILVALDVPFSGEKSERRLETDFFGDPGPRELAYWVFPVSDVDVATGLSSRVLEIGTPATGLIEVVVGGPNGRLNYRIRPSDLDAPVVESVIPQTSFRQAHDLVASDGRLADRLGHELPVEYYRIHAHGTVPDPAALESMLDPRSRGEKEVIQGVGHLVPSPGP